MAILTARRAGVLGGILLALCLAGSLAAPLRAAEPGAAEPEKNWPTSPYHGRIDGATGRPIPCRCRFEEKLLPLDSEACMFGQLMRCDLSQNVTSWIRTGKQCHAPVS